LRGTQVGTDMYGIFAPGTDTENPGYGTGWSDAGVIIPWSSWIQYGDSKVIEENWEGMEKYLAAILAANPDFVDRKSYGIAFADWLAPEGVTPGGFNRHRLLGVRRHPDAPNGSRRREDG
jgi:alpha-L-rhamnosidase